MNYAVADILKDVRITLDQNQVESILAADDDTLELDDIIRKNIEEAGLRILREAPLRMIDDTKSLALMAVIDGVETVSNISVEDGVVTITLPDDYLRVAIVQMSDWKTPVRSAVLDTSEDYMSTRSAFDGVRPNTYRPIVVETEDGENNPILECYGSEDADDDITVAKGRYIAIPKIKSSVDSGTHQAVEVFNFPKLLYHALVNMTAALTAQSVKDPSAQSLMTLALQYMGVTQ